MALETEVKIRLDSVEAGRERLEKAGFQPSRPREFESNQLYDTEDQWLRSAGELVRIRQVGGRGLLTFKGRSTSGEHKVREEIETAVEDVAQLGAILERLGYAPTFRYEKYRTEYTSNGHTGHVLLDETPIGSFLELEGDGAWINETAEKLGFSKQDYVIDSYGALYVKYCKQRGLAVSSMTFV